MSNAFSLIVLVVEDNDDLREMAVVMVGELGHHVLSASDGNEALTIVESTPVDLLFTDIIMPGRSGFELARQAMALRPTLAVVYATGFAPMLTDEQGEALGPILRKPYRQAHIADAINKALTGTSREVKSAHLKPNL